MTLRLSPIVLGILGIAFAAHSGEQAAPLRRIYQAPIELSKYGLIFTKVNIKGKEVSALIDTGSSSHVLLSATLAHDLKMTLIEDKNSTTRGLDGKVFPIQKGHIETMRIGDYEGRGVPFQVAGDRIESIGKK